MRRLLLLAHRGREHVDELHYLWSTLLNEPNYTGLYGNMLHLEHEHVTRLTRAATQL